MIREATVSDVAEVVPICLESFPGHFSTSLGKRFLNYYYRKQVEAPDFVFLVNSDEAGRALRFVIGSPCSNPAYGRLVRSKLCPRFSAAVSGAEKGLENPRGEPSRHQRF